MSKIKVKPVVPSSSYPTMTTGSWSHSPATYGIMRDGTQIGLIHQNGRLWFICDNEYRSRPGLFFMNFKDARAWAVANYEL